MTTKTFTVTVSNPGSGNRYYLDGVLQAIPSLAYGATYRFDQSDSSNSGHPLRLSATSDGTHGGGSEYTVGVTTVGTPGSAGAYTEIQIANSAPSPLYYYCSVHSGMGSQANVTSNSWGALEWNEGNWSGQGDNTVQLTGQQSTLSLASITTDQTADIDVTGIQLTATNGGAVGGSSVSFDVSGIQSTFSINQVITGFGVNITGSSISTSMGDVTIDEDLLIGAGWGRDTYGNLGWGVNYSANPAEGTGIELTSSIGEETAFTDVTINITGLELTIDFANPSFSIQIDQDIFVLASEDQLDASVGTIADVTGTATVDVTGIELTSNIGQVIPEPKLEVPVTGISASMTIGNISLIQSTVEPVTGQQLTGSVGEVDAISVAEVSGIELTGSVGSVTVDAGAEVNVSGISASISVGQVAVTPWQEINPGVNNVWTEVDLAA